jgi:hypothetical protein
MAALLAPTTDRPGRPAPVADDARRPSLCGAAARPSTATFWRRRLAVLVAFVVLAFLLTVAIGRVGAQAELRNQVAGHVVVQPGQTLWDVAVASAPDGMDVRRQLADIEALNDLRAHQVDAWTVVLLPAR